MLLPCFRHQRSGIAGKVQLKTAKTRLILWKADYSFLSPNLPSSKDGNVEPARTDRKSLKYAKFNLLYMAILVTANLVPLIFLALVLREFLDYIASPEVLQIFWDLPSWFDWVWFDCQKSSGLFMLTCA